MADNVPITAGVGTSVATDDVSGAHYQRMKLATSEDGSADGYGDDDKGATRALWVVLRPNVVTSQQNSAGLTIATTAYSAGDVLGDGWSFTGAARATGGTGRVTGAVLLDVADKINGVDLYLAATTVTLGTDNAAPSISDADAAKLGHVIELPDAVDLGGSRLAQVHGLDVPYLCDATTLYVCAIARDPCDFFAAVTDLKLRLFLEPD